MHTAIGKLFKILGMLSLVYLIFIYTISHIYQWLNIEISNIYLKSLVYFLIYVFPVSSLIIGYSKGIEIGKFIGSYSLACCFIALPIIVVAESVMALGILDSYASNENIQLFALIFIGLMIFIALICGQVIKVRYREIMSSKIDKNIRIVHLSDIHIGSKKPNYLFKIIEKVNQLKPDLILVTGDILDSRHNKVSDLVAFKSLDMPIYAVTGNHEDYIDTQNSLNIISSNNVHVLDEQKANHFNLEILGIKDYESIDRIVDSNALINLVTPSKFTILMYHRPDIWDYAKVNHVDLSLCGHTHNGQIWPFNWIVKLQYAYIHGWYKHTHQMNTNYLNVLSGTGTWGPSMRLGSFNEIGCIDLKHVSSNKKH